MDDKVRITVIMSVYNDGKTVGRAVQSIIDQSYKQWIMIICDDGSKDNTIDVLTEYKEKLPNKIIILRNKDNRGITYSLNRMIKMCETEYIARMDADDFSHPDRLEREICYLDTHPSIAVVGCSINKFDENGIIRSVIYPPKPSTKTLIKFSPFAHPTIMIRSDVICLLNGYRDIKKTNRCEDYDLWFRLYEKGYVGHNLSDILFDYYEGKSTYKKRKIKYRITEMLTRIEGYRRNNLYPMALPYIFKPVFVGIIPTSIMYWYKSKIQKLNK